MRNEATPVDYGRAKVAALQPLAAKGDRHAVRELARRGITPSADADVTKATYLELRSLVLAWRDGTTRAERDRALVLACQAQRELEIRYAVDLKLHDGHGRAPVPPPAPPWKAPRPPRCRDWQRPKGSTCYPVR